MISVGSASVGAAATGAGASSGATRPFWYIWGGAAGAAGAASPGASSANDGSTTAHKLPASIARREVGLPHGRSVRPDAAESSAQSTRLDLMGRAVTAQRGGRCGPQKCHRLIRHSPPTSTEVCYLTVSTGARSLRPRAAVATCSPAGSTPAPPRACASGAARRRAGAPIARAARRRRWSRTSCTRA